MKKVMASSHEKFRETVKPPRPQTYYFNFLFYIISESFRIIELFMDWGEV